MTDDALIDARLAMLGELQDDWDSYGAKPPTPEALAAMGALLKNSEDLPFHYAIVPTYDGGLECEWQINDVDVWLIAKPDGAVQIQIDEFCTGRLRSIDD